MKRKHKRLTFVMIALGLLAAAAGLILNALEDNIVFFRSPSDVMAQPPPPGKRFRIGGLVEEGSVTKPGGAVVRFRVTDLAQSVPVTYRGILPDLFREGQGVVAEGSMEDGVFVAAEVLAKHDETYMPPEVVDALKRSGQWKETEDGMKDIPKKPGRDG